MTGALLPCVPPIVSSPAHSLSASLRQRAAVTTTAPTTHRHGLLGPRRGPRRAAARAVRGRDRHRHRGPLRRLGRDAAADPGGGRQLARRRLLLAGRRLPRGAVGDRRVDATLPESCSTRFRPRCARPNGDWVGLSGRARTVIYNTDESPRPTSPTRSSTSPTRRGSGRIGWAPTNASFQDFVTALRALEGEDAAREWLEGIVANGVPYEGNTAIVEAVAAGEVEVGSRTTTTCTASSPRTPTTRRQQVLPGGDPGSLINIAGAGVLATTDEPDAATGADRVPPLADRPGVLRRRDLRDPRRRRRRGAGGPAAVDTLSNLPEFDLNLLLDLQGTVDLLTEVGAL
jgi:iron(III) transport system substrate-binding protein